MRSSNRPGAGAALAWVAVALLAVTVVACAQGTSSPGLGGSSAGGSGATTAAPGGGGSGGDGGDGGGCAGAEQIAGDCKKKVCEGGAVTEVADDTDLPSDGKVCTTDVCSLGAPSFLAIAAGALCSEGGGKKCDGAGECVACLVVTDCAPGETCSAAHACVPASCVDGQTNGDETDVDCGGSCGATCDPGEACLGTGDCALGECEGNVCVYSPCEDGAQNGDETDVDCGGSCVLGADPKTCGPGEGCAVDDDCTGGDCGGATCVPNCFDGAQNNGEAGTDCGGPCAACLFGAPCAGAADCSGGPCVDGVCCDGPCSGACEACSAAKKGSGADGLCGDVAAGTDPDGECAGALACGAGQCQIANGQACGQAAECQSGFCVDGVCCGAACTATCQACTTAKKGSGQNGTCGNIAVGTDPDMECFGATACNGASACALQSNGSACTAGGECTSGFCVDDVCCNNACDLECQACSTAKKGAGANGSCGAITVGGDPDDECAGALVCATGGCKLPAGEPCFSAAQCVAGFCVDGVCCNAACTGPCLACIAAKKGSGVDGTCGNIGFGADPDDECGGMAACSGAGACALYADGVFCAASNECASNQCVDGVCCNNACTATCQACSAAKKNAGVDGVCGTIMAGLDPDMECPGATSCGGATSCVLFPNGTPCAAANECASNQCVDGVCCNNACTATCQACTAAKKGSGASGTCGSIAATTDPDSECTGVAACGGAAACAFLVNGTACSLNGECASNNCVDGVCCSTSCNTPCQACTAAKKGSGADGTCGNIAVGADPDNECAGAQICNGAGACKAPTGATCVAAADCLSAFCADGVCCNAVCTGACQACTAAKKGSGADGTCGNVALGADPDNECFGSLACGGAGACLLGSQGTVCTVGAECQSGFCVDGTCCNTACNAICNACTAVKKNTGANGTCGVIQSGFDPDAECPGATSCSGAGSCALFANGAACSLHGECLSGSCADGVCCNLPCTGECQACTAAKKGSGGNGQCGSIAATTDPDAECPGATSCSGAGACALFGPAALCSLDAECQSGSCADGVCCDAACDGLCEACVAFKTGVASGTCAGVVPGTDPDDECDDLTSSPSCAAAMMCGP